VPISGTLNIIGQEAFLDPVAGQAIDEETLMLMNDLPPNSNQQDKIDAAPGYFRNVLHKNSGGPIVVTATGVPFGAKQILVAGELLMIAAPDLSAGGPQLQPYAAINAPSNWFSFSRRWIRSLTRSQIRYQSRFAARTGEIASMRVQCR
jgi:hypothetical protein